MSFDAGLAQRLRETCADLGVTAVEKKMFGGVAFMVNGHMSCGINGTSLMARVGPAAHADAMRRPHARPMDFTGRPLKGFVFVDPEGFESDADLRQWVELSLDFIHTLAPKPNRQNGISKRHEP